MITTLVCHISLGVGALTLVPGIVEVPRYKETEIRIELDGSKLVDIRVDGPFDRAYSYVEHGYALSSARLADRLLLEAKIEGLNAEREQLIITDAGQLIWTQIGNADELRTSSGSLFVGSCK